MLGGLPGFGMRIALAVFHCLGSRPVRQHLLKKCARASMAASLRFVSALLVALSGPAADLLLRFCRATRTAHVSMSLSSVALLLLW